MTQENTILMEEIGMEYRDKSEVADVAIDGPPKKLKEQIQRTVEPKVKRKRGRPRKKVFFHFTKNCGNGKPKKPKDIPPLEPWTFTRLRQNGREEKLEKMRRNANDMLKVTAMVQRERMRKWREKQKDRRCTDGTSIEPVKTVWFVKTKEEQYMDVTSPEESDMCGKIETDDRLKIENPEAENQQINGVVSYTEPYVQLHHQWNQKPLAAENSVHRESETPDFTIGIALDPQSTAFDLLYHSTMIKCRKLNSYQTQQQNRLQRFVKLRTSRPCDYIMAAVAWHKLNALEIRQKIG